MRTAVTRALGGALLVVTLTSGLAACTDDDGSSTPTPEPSTEPTSAPPEPVDLFFGVFGTNEEIAAYPTMAKHFDTVNDRADVTVTAWQNHDGLRRAIEQGKPLPDVFLVSRRDLRWFVDNELTQSGRHPARRARRRLRRRLLARRPRGVQQRQPPAVHAVRRLAPGGLLQREHGRLQPDGDPRARRPERPPALELGPVRDGGEVRGASLPRHQGRRDRPDPAGARAVRLLRRRRPLRRRHRPDVAGLQRRGHAGRPRDRPHAVPRPQADPDPGAARREVPARVVRGGQGRDDHRQPGAGAGAARRCRASAST